MRLSVAVGLSLVAALFSACPPVSGCGPTTCQGCCDARGTCQMGISSSACGARGALCTECGLGLTCSTAGACMFTNGTGGGFSGTGGGIAIGGGSSGGLASGGGFVTGGGIGRIDQELVSGTRLRAINFVGSDGSRAPLAFWDNQLDTVCAASLGIFGAGSRCIPSLLMPPIEGAFGDPGCTNPLFGYAIQLPTLGPELYTAVGLPSPKVYGYSSTTNDGGFTFTFHSVVPATARFNRNGSTCGSVALAGSMYVSTGTISPTTFAPMSVVRE